MIEGLAIGAAGTLILLAVFNKSIRKLRERAESDWLIVRREIDEDRLHRCPVDKMPHRPSISGEFRKITNARTDPYWGPILFPDGPHGKLNEGELAAHLEDYGRLCNGACEVVSTYARGMSGGYKFYTCGAVLSQIQATIENAETLAVDLFIEDHQINEMKSFVVDLEAALACPNNSADWRAGPQGTELLERARGFIPAAPKTQIAPGNEKLFKVDEKNA